MVYVVDCGLAVNPNLVRQQMEGGIEGLAGREADALRAAWTDLDVLQCGYCQSGQLMSTCALLKKIPKPSDAEIDQAMSGNICRCGTYPRIRIAIHQAAESA